MTNDEFKTDIEDILKRLLSEKKTVQHIIFTLCRSAMEFARRGEIERMETVWSYASKLNALGRGPFESRLYSGELFKSIGRPKK